MIRRTCSVFYRHFPFSYAGSKGATKVEQEQPEF